MENEHQDDDTIRDLTAALAPLRQAAETRFSLAGIPEVARVRELAARAPDSWKARGSRPARHFSGRQRDAELVQPGDRLGHRPGLAIANIGRVNGAIESARPFLESKQQVVIFDRPAAQRVAGDVGEGADDAVRAATAKYGNLREDVDFN